MIFDLVSPSFYPYLSGSASIFLLLYLFLFLQSERKLPTGELKKRFTLLLFLAFMSCLPSILVSLPIGKEIKDILFCLTFSWFSSLPLILFIVMEDANLYSGKLRTLFFTMVAILLVAPLIHYQSIKILFFLIFLPGWVAVSILSFEIFSKTIAPGRRRFHFHTASATIISGTGFFLDILFVNRIQEIPLLTIAGAAWSFFIVAGVIFQNVPEEPKPGDAAVYVIVPFSILIAIGAFKILDLFLIQRDQVLFMTTYRIPVCIVFSIAFAYLTILAVSSASRWINNVSERLMDPFAKALMEIERKAVHKLFPDEAEKLARSFSDISCIIWVRRRNCRECIPALDSIPSPFDRDDRLIFNRVIENQMKKTGFVLMNPINVEEFATGQTSFDKILSIADKRNFLVSFCNYIEHSSSLPTAVLTSYKTGDINLKEAEIRNLMHLSFLVGKEIEKIHRDEQSRHEEHLVHLFGAKDVSNLVGILREDPACLLESSEICLCMQESENLKWSYYVISGTEPPDPLKPDDFSNYVSDACGLLIIPSNNSGGKITRILPIPSKTINSFLAFTYNCEEFVYEPDDRDRFKNIAGNLGLIIDRMAIESNFNQQAKELESILIQAEQNLAEQKKQMAEDIHDTVAQEIYAARMQINLLEKKFKDRQLETWEEIEILKETVVKGLRDIRNLIWELRTSTSIPDTDHYAEITGFLRRVEKESGISIASSGMENLNKINLSLAQDFTLIVKEAVNNIRKHSQATKAVVRLKERKNRLTLLVIDDGSGFDKKNLSEKNARFGLQSISSRCKRHQCRFLLKTIRSKGTAISVSCHYLKD